MVILALTGTIGGIARMFHLDRICSIVDADVIASSLSSLCRTGNEESKSGLINLVQRSVDVMLDKPRLHHLVLVH